MLCRSQVDTCVGVTGGAPCTHNSKYNALISSKWKLIEANFYYLLCPNTTWCTGAGLYDGWWTNDPYTHVPYNATTQGSLPVSGLDRGGLWLFDLEADREAAMPRLRDPKASDSHRGPNAFD